MKKFFLLIICFVLMKDGFGQFVYKDLPNKLITQVNEKGDYVSQLRIAKQKAHDLTEELPKGYVKSGKIDYTEYMQRGLDNHTVVIFPDFPVLINEEGLTLKSNSIVIFNTNSKLILSPNKREWYEILRLHGVSNVKIFDANIVGDRDGHKGTTGEWGMGIAMRGADNIKIYNPNIQKCWGDGIVMGILDGQPTTNVEIMNARLDFNRRNGIAMGSVKNIKIVNPVISNTEGTLPMAGICIEPNNNREVCDHISIINPLTFNNANAGIQIGLAKLPGALTKEVNIIVENHVDYDSKIGFHMGGFNKIYNAAKPLKGKISINRPSWNSNRNSLKTGNNYDIGPSVVISDVKIENVHTYQREENLKKRINSKHKKILMR